MQRRNAFPKDDSGQPLPLKPNWLAAKAYLQKRHTLTQRGEREIVNFGKPESHGLHKAFGWMTSKVSRHRRTGTDARLQIARRFQDDLRYSPDRLAGLQVQQPLPHRETPKVHAHAYAHERERDRERDHEYEHEPNNKHAFQVGHDNDNDNDNEHEYDHDHDLINADEREKQEDKDKEKKKEKVQIIDMLEELEGDVEGKEETARKEPVDANSAERKLYPTVDRSQSYSREQQIQRQIQQAHELLAQTMHARMESADFGSEDGLAEVLSPHANSSGTLLSSDEKELEVTVNKIQGHVATLVTRDCFIITWPLVLLPPDVQRGHRFSIFLQKTTEAETRRASAICALQSELQTQLASIPD